MAINAEDLNIILSAKDATFARAMERNAKRVADFERRANSSLGGTARGFDTMSRAGNAATSNMTAQLNDIFVMTAAGQAPLQMAIQQGMQIIQIMGPAGAAGAVSMLGAAMKQFLNPMNFVILATIAGGAALTQWAMSGEDAKSATERLADEIKTLGDAMSALRDAEKASSSEVMTVAQEYGVAAEEARAFLDIKRQIAEVKATRAFNAATSSTADVFGGGMNEFSSAELQGYAAQLAEIRKELESLTTAEATFGDIKSQADADAWEALQARIIANDVAFAQTTNYRKAVADLAVQFGITDQAAADMAVTAAKMREADNTKERTAAAKALAEMIYNVTDGLANSSDESVELYDGLMKVVETGLQFQGLNLSGNIADAVNTANQLAKSLGVSAKIASEMMGRGYEFNEPVVFDPRDPKYDPTKAAREQIRLGVYGKSYLDDLPTASAGGAKEAAKAAESAQEAFDKMLESIIATNPALEALGFDAQKLNGIMDTVGNSFDQSFMGIVDGTMTAQDAFKSMAANVIRELYRVLVVQRLVGSFDQKGKGILGGLFNLFGGGAGRASGGSVMAGNAYRVGENGPEPFIPAQNGRILSTAQAKGALAGGGGGTTVVQNISFGAGVSRAEVSAMIPKIVDATKAAVIDAQRRSGGR